jgi:phosphoribosyl 1,2-cyclic phosphodiesterase
MRFASLGSGSEGNSLLVEAAEGGATTRVLLDCGFGIKETERRLARLGCTADQLSAVIVTHEHSDHIGSAYAFGARHDIPVWLSHGTWSATSSMRGAADADLHFCSADQPFSVGALEILPYTVPHDAREPVQFVFGDGNVKLGVLTDAGIETPYVVAHLQGLHALVLECNHDREMLARSPYPAYLKARIGGNFGHLANDIAASILGQVKHAALSAVVAAHLSKQNNTPALAAEALATVLGANLEDVLIADQAAGLAWQRVG